VQGIKDMLTSSLIVLDLLLFILLRIRLNNSLREQERDLGRLQSELKYAENQNLKLKRENAVLEKSVSETVALYDITREICKSLDEAKMFGYFKERLHSYLGVKECKFIKGESLSQEYKDYISLALVIHKKTIGFLLAGGIMHRDKEKFHILAQQYLLGLKRSVLFQEVQGLTITDSLTQLFNRRYFLLKLNEEFLRSKKYSYNFSFLMIDIDHFKELNDKYGHLAGDAILRESANIIKENIRQVDFMGRYGGEELSVILTETAKAQALQVAERIRLAVEAKRFFVYDEELRVTISIGIASFPQDSSETPTIIEKADQSLYLAKESGRNKVVCA
jgi:diguanylate cyclase (GGDEF)-like protein